jgi:hypothetical protein
MFKQFIKNMSVTECNQYSLVCNQRFKFLVGNHSKFARLWPPSQLDLLLEMQEAMDLASRELNKRHIQLSGILDILA